MRPFVLINVAMTADGKIDTYQRTGASISSPEDRRRVDELRAEADAVLVGGQTLNHEGPKLTVKNADLRAKRVESGLPENPAKVGIVTRATLSPDSGFLTAGPARKVIFTTHQTDAAQLELLRSAGVDLFIHQEERVNLPQALETLTQLGIKRVMVEGGARLNFALMQLGLVDELSAYLAPMVFGGETAPTAAGGPGLARSGAIQLELVEARVLDPGGGLVIRYRFPK